MLRPGSHPTVCGLRGLVCGPGTGIFKSSLSGPQPGLRTTDLETDCSPPAATPQPLLYPWTPSFFGWVVSLHLLQLSPPLCVLSWGSHRVCANSTP